MLSGMRIVAKRASSKSVIGASAIVGFAGAAAVSGGAVMASDSLAAPQYNWEFNGMFKSFDAASIRRGYEVYRQVCSTCHGITTAYRELVGVSHDKAQAKALAQSITVMDGPNADGEMYERPGKLSDKHPQPYPNEEYARMINSGALPPDLTLIAKARVGGPDYIFALLTGYVDPPAGCELREGLHYNPYFPGGAIGMAKALQDEGVEYEDDTVPTISQQAKDVAAFLEWAAEPEHDERKVMGTTFLGAVAFGALCFGYLKRFKYNSIKTRKISYTDKF